MAQGAAQHREGVGVTAGKPTPFLSQFIRQPWFILAKFCKELVDLRALGAQPAPADDPRSRGAGGSREGERHWIRGREQPPLHCTARMKPSIKMEQKKEQKREWIWVPSPQPINFKG